MPVIMCDASSGLPSNSALNAPVVFRVKLEMPKRPSQTRKRATILQGSANGFTMCCPYVLVPIALLRTSVRLVMNPLHPGFRLDGGAHPNGTRALIIGVPDVGRKGYLTPITCYVTQLVSGKCPSSPD